MTRTRAQRWLIRAAAAGLVLAIACGAASWALWGPTASSDEQKGEVIEIEPGTSFRQIAARLAEKKLVRSQVGFMILAKIQGDAARLRAGEFMIPRGIGAQTVLNLLVYGPVLQRRLTIPEGYNTRQIRRVMAERQVDDPAIIEALFADLPFARSLGIPADSLEGYLFPDTYQFTKGFGAKKMVEAMVARFFQVYEDAFQHRAQERGLTMHQVVTLASIVEKETGAPGERPLIARVFLNRLAIGMRLQSDPTVIYGLGDRYTGRLLKRDLEEPVLYNTYVFAGLPPGPIASPGRAAIQAVLWPSDSDDLYFVSRNDGTHVFSRTYEEHRRHVDRYQRSGKGGAP